LKPTQVKRRRRKLDWPALEKDVEENHKARLIDRARKFGVRPSAIHYALKELKIRRKKKKFATGKETALKESNIIGY
jgi:transposase